MGRNRKLTCRICQKEFRSDKIKAHEVVCERRKEKASRPTQVTVEAEIHHGGLIITEAEAEGDEEDENEVITEETEADREFITDEEIRESTDEIAERLAWLQDRVAQDRVGYTPCIHCKVYILDSEIQKHSKNCPEKLLNCYKCNKQYPAKVIKKHYLSCTVKKKPSGKPVQNQKTKTTGGNKNVSKSKGKKRRRKTSGTSEGNESGGEGDNQNQERKKRKRKGTQFKLEFHRARKYTIIRKLREYDIEEKKYCLPNWISQLILGNEFGAGPNPHPHTHAVIVTHQKMTFQEFKELFKMKTKLRIHDIQSCKNIRHEIKYVCKEDYRPIVYNIDWDLLTVIVQAYVASQKYNVLTSTTYPYCRMSPFQKSQFRTLFQDFVNERETDETRVKYEVNALRPWQERLLRVVEYLKSDRKIIWVYDKVGNHGKSYFSFYLQYLHQAFRVPGVVMGKDFAFSYNYQKIVVFDIDRDSQNTVNYRLLENLKDGAIWSPKYESQVKTFGHSYVQVLCLANFPPEIDRLSHDRWHIFKLQNNELTFERVETHLATVVVNE